MRMTAAVYFFPARALAVAFTMASDVIVALLVVSPHAVEVPEGMPASLVEFATPRLRNTRGEAVGDVHVIAA